MIRVAVDRADAATPGNIGIAFAGSDHRGTATVLVESARRGWFSDETGAMLVESAISSLEWELARIAFEASRQ